MSKRTKGNLTLTVIVLSLFIVSCGGKRSPQASFGSASAMPVTRTLSPLPMRPLSPRLQSLRARAMRTASDLRELPFKEDVGMAELSGWEYGTRTSEMAELLGGDDLRALSRLAVAGDLLPPGTDLATLAASFTAASAGATYSPLDRQILLVDKFTGDSLLTHELTHALQDQHFDLLKLLVVRPYNFDRTEALFALIEGDAMNIQRRSEEGEAYGRKKLDEIAKQENDRFGEYRKEVDALFPPLVTETFIFRYRDGARFVENIRRSRGERGVDDLFLHPPVSSQQILHPEKYLSQEAPREIHLDEGALTRSGWRLVTSTPLGEIGVRGLLAAGASDRDAAHAASAWAGDCAYLFDRQGASPLFVWKTAWNTQPAAREFFRAYNVMERRRGGEEQPVEAVGVDAEAVWRTGGLTTLVRRAGDQVLVLRGAEPDLQSALEAALGNP